jgi:signal transduction histidine kinase
MEVILRQNEAHYQKMVANVPGLVYQFLLRTDGSMEFLFVSNSCMELFALEPEQVKSDSDILFSKLHPNERAEFYRLIAKSAEDLSPFEWQGRAIIEGKERWYQSVSRPERLDNGDTLWDGLLLDVTDYKRIEQEVASLAKFPKENPSPVMRISSEGVILYANEASEPLLGLWGRKTGQVVTDNIYDLTSTVRTAKADHDMEVQCGERIFSLIFAYIPDADYVNIYGSDITMGKHAEMELIKKNEILGEHDRLKSEFVSTVSHELRTPLFIFKNIVSNAMAGVMGKVSHRLYESLKMADKSIDRLSRIVSDFLDISRIESGEMRLRRAVIPIQTVVSEVVDSLEILASAKDIELKTNLLKEELLVNIDRDRIVQVLTNLIGNAIKFIPVSGQINVDVADCGCEVRVAVRDNGPGLSKDETEKVFDRFVQIHQFAGPGEHGTGLGLTIAKELVQMHGGRIWVESSPGGGCCFFFTLPKCDSQVSEAMAQETATGGKN